jgi:hypothetical protein
MRVDQSRQRCAIGALADVPVVQMGELAQGGAWQVSAMRVRPRLMPSARITVRSALRSSAGRPERRW